MILLLRTYFCALWLVIPDISNLWSPSQGLKGVIGRAGVELVWVGFGFGVGLDCVGIGGRVGVVLGCGSIDRIGLGSLATRQCTASVG